MFNINKINLSNFIKGLSLTVLYTLVKNKIKINFNTLTDTKANRFVFINLTLTSQLYTKLGLQLISLSYIIQAKEYNKQAGQTISHYLILNLIFIGRC